MWKEYFIMNMRVVIKIYEATSRYGLPQFPRISKMEVWQFGKQLMNYDRGMDFNNLPDGVLEAILKSIGRLLLLAIDLF